MLCLLGGAFPFLESKKMREWVLSELNHALIRSQKWEVAVLPFGATEPHNLHMPYGTDNFEVHEIGSRACELAYKTGAKVVLLPTIPYGVNTNHLKIPGALACSVTPSTLLRILTDLVDSLERQGVRKLVLLNGHGGNELKPLMRELHHRTGVFLCLCDWFSMTRPWHLVTTNTGLGDPRAATADKGRRLMDILVERLGQFLVDLAALP